MNVVSQSAIDAIGDAWSHCHAIWQRTISFIMVIKDNHGINIVFIKLLKLIRIGGMLRPFRCYLYVG